MAKIKSGGGLTSNKLVNVGVKAGPARTNIVSPASADQLGQSVAFKRDPLPIGTAAQVPMGNEVALNVKGGGPGQRASDLPLRVSRNARSNRGRRATSTRFSGSWPKINFK